MFLSDGVVFMPALLTDVAWERLQELEERDCFTGLENAIVSVQKFSLHFHMEPELMSCYFYLTVNQLSTLGQGNVHKHTPSCTTLPSVRELIKTTWRSQLNENSSSQAGFQLSNLMGMWQNDIISGMQNEIIDRLNMPGTSEQSVTALTGWHQDRLLYKAEGCFSVPASHLLRPEAQETVESSGSETQSGLGLVPDQNFAVQTEEASQTLLSGDSLADNRPFFSQVSHDTGILSQACEWDMFQPAVELLETSSASDISATPEDLQPQQNQLASVTLKNLSASNTPDTLPCEQSRSQPLSLPVATGTKKELLNSSGAEKAEISLLCGQQPLSLQSNPSHSKRKLSTQEELEEDEEDDRAAGSPPTWLAIMQQTRCSNDEGNGPKRPTLAASVQQNWIHPDGSSFSYRYKPSAHVAMALCQFKIPENVMRWSVCYLSPSYTEKQDGDMTVTKT
ncbi:adrenocortical dysplasia protein homolog isoform X2 [Denticeps clupeoides]|nr:uncharacterized protein LOC114790912 isoform X2 [Denticeps clupeoides]